MKKISKDSGLFENPNDDLEQEQEVDDKVLLKNISINTMKMRQILEKISADPVKNLKTISTPHNRDKELKEQTKLLKAIKNGIVLKDTNTTNYTRNNVKNKQLNHLSTINKFDRSQFNTGTNTVNKHNAHIVNYAVKDNPLPPGIVQDKNGRLRDSRGRFVSNNFFVSKTAPITKVKNTHINQVNNKPSSSSKNTNYDTHNITQTTQAELNQSISKNTITNDKLTATLKSETIQSHNTKTHTPTDNKKDSNTNGKLRDSRGKFIKQASSDTDTEDYATKRKLFDSLNDIKDAMPNVENVDPVIGAAKEISDTISTTKNITTKVFSGIKKFNPFKKNDEESTQKRQEKKTSVFRKKTLDFLKKITDKPVSNTTMGGFGSLFDMLGGKKIKGILGTIAGALGLKKLKSIFKLKGLTTAFGKLGTIGLGIKSIFKGGIGAAVKGGAKRIPILGSLLSFADGGIGGGIGSILGGTVGTFFGGPIGTVIGGIVGEQLGKWLQGLDWGTVGKKITTTWDNTTNYFKDIWQKITNPFSTIFDIGKKAFDTVKNAIPQNAFTKAMGNVWNGVTKLFSSSPKKSNEYKSPKYNYTGENTIGSFSKKETGAYLNGILARESGGNLKSVNKFGYLGLYQMGASALASAGMINKDKYASAVKKYGKDLSTGRNAKIHNDFLNNPDNWTIAGGKEAFLNSKALQDKAMVNYTNKNLAFLTQNGVATNDKQAIFGLLMAAHLKGAAAAKNFALNGIDGKDGFGTSVSNYFAQGEKTYQTFVAKNNLMPKQTMINNSTVLSPLSKIVKSNIFTLNNEKAQSLIVKASQNTPKKGTESSKGMNQPMIFNQHTDFTNQLLTQDVSDRQIAHIVTGGLVKFNPLR